MKIYFYILWGALLIDIISYQIKFKLYFNMPYYFKYTRFGVVSLIEKITYRMERVGGKIPFLLIKPNRFEIGRIKNDFRDSVFLLEKIIIFIEYILSTVGQIVGIRIAYIICGLVYIFKKYKIQIYDKSIQVFKFISKIDFISTIQKIYEYIYNNSIGILILVIILLIWYIYYYKTKISKYNFENIWKEEIEQNVNTIAIAQKVIEQDMKELIGVVLNNVDELQMLINRFDRIYEYDQEYFKSNNERYVYQSFREYNQLVINIKEQIHVIEKNNGESLYRKYNEKVWDQLIKLGLTDSDNKNYSIRNLVDCDKESIERTLSNFNEGYPAIRKRLMLKWSNGVFCFNRIARYLEYVQIRKTKFEHLNMRLARANRYSLMINEVKDTLDK